LNSNKLLNSNEMIDAACAATRLKDFGDPPLFPALEVMVKSINEEANLTDFGAEMRRQKIIQLLVNRLLLTDRLKRQPELNEISLGPQLIIVGLPRSGTTKMLRMLCRDRRFNNIALWENSFPIALSDSPDDRQKRIEYGQAFCDAVQQAAPDFYAVHPIDSEEPEEEMVLMQHSFLTEAIDAEMYVPSYQAWLREQNKRPMYEQLRTWLKVLAYEHGKPNNPWILKGTYHGPYLDILLDVFPESKVIYSHRDPVDTISSYCSLIAKLRSLLSERVNKQDVGPELLHTWVGQQNAMMQARARADESRILDLAYPDIVRNMSAVIERVYDFADIELTDETKEAFADWEQENAQHKHGKHEYRTEEFGISKADIAEAFKDYRDKYIN
jgi:Sulfotransferase family